MNIKVDDTNKNLHEENTQTIGNDPISSHDSSHNDINANLGKFDKKNTPPHEIKINPLHKINIDKQKLNFAKFETKKTNLFTKNKFFENFGILLNKKK